MEFYDTSQWKAMRDHILKRDGYACQVSKRYGKNRPAEIVHHVFPLKEFSQYAMEEWNLISVTKAEHNRLHYRDTDDLTEDGAELLRRIARRNNVPIPDKYRDKVKRSFRYGRATR